MKKTSVTHQAISFEEVVPRSIAWITRAQMMQILDLEDAQLRRDQVLLCYLETPTFDYQKGDMGFTWESARCLWEFRKLVRRYGRRKRAIAQINQVIVAACKHNRFGSQTSAFSAQIN